MSIPTEYIAIIAVALAGTNVTVSAGKVLVSAISPAVIEATAINAPEQVRAGSDVMIDWTIIKRTNCPGATGRVWVGENGFYLSETLRPTGLPRSDKPILYSIATEIPDMAPLGTLSLSIRGSYHCPGKAAESFALGPVEMEVVE